MPKTTEIDVAQAQRMRDGGMSWEELAEVFGAAPATMHMKLDPIYAEKRRQQINEARRRKGKQRDRPTANTSEDKLALLAVVPDTRTWQQKLFGDPIPSRSSLARKQTT